MTNLYETFKKRVRKYLGIKTKLEILMHRGLKVGNNFSMQEGCIIDDSHCWHIHIGDNVTLAPKVHILAHDASTKMYLGYTKIKNVNIGNRVFVGAGSIIMPGVNIGNNVVIGAGSIVTKDLKENSVYVGNPAEYIMSIEDFLNQQKLKMHKENVFGEEFTLRKNITNDMKEVMKKAVDKFKIGFVE